MKVNVGTADRAARAALAMVMLGIGLKKQGRLGVISAFLAGEFLSSAVSGYCPMYQLMGISTAGKGEPA
jgi:hypothetical protein